MICIPCPVSPSIPAETAVDGVAAAVLDLEDGSGALWTGLDILAAGGGCWAGLATVGGAATAEAEGLLAAFALDLGAGSQALVANIGVFAVCCRAEAHLQGKRGIGWRGGWEIAEDGGGMGNLVF